MDPKNSFQILSCTQTNQQTNKRTETIDCSFLFDMGQTLDIAGSCQFLSKL